MENLSLLIGNTGETHEIAGHEIASHSHTHIHVDEITPSQLEDEIETSKKSIQHHVGIDALSFVYPGGAYDLQSRDVVEGFFISARTSDDGFNNASPSDICLLKSKTAASFNAIKMNAWADKAEKEGFWLVENVHLVSDENPTGYSFYLSTEDFTDHLDYLVSKDLWLAPHVEVAKYVLERENTKIEVVSKSRRKIVLNLLSRTDPSIYDVPLTILIKLPDDWNSVYVAQNGETVDSFISKGSLFINVAPNIGEIKIKKK
jgi:hypothetical protein